MFLYFIFVLLAIIAIVVTVRLLHNNQQRALQERANEDLSLPPVDPDSIPEREGLEWEEDNTPSAFTTAEREPAKEHQAEPATDPQPESEIQNELALAELSDKPDCVDSTLAPAEPEPEPEPEPEFRLEPTTDAGSSPAHQDSVNSSKDSAPLDWKEQVQALKNDNLFDDALRACQAGWPQWQSYQQAAIVCRAALKQPTLAEEEAESWREALYLLATHASFLHDKIEGLENLSWQRLERTLSVEDLRNLESNWQEIGYKKLRLLNKTDIRILTSVWGEPARHQSAKRYYKNRFMSITSS